MFVLLLNSALEFKIMKLHKINQELYINDANLLFIYADDVNIVGDEGGGDK